MERRLFLFFSKTNKYISASSQRLRANQAYLKNIKSGSALCFLHEDVKSRLRSGPDLNHFLKTSAITNESVDCDVPYIPKSKFSGLNRKVFFEVYGCQMNESDTEIIWSILKDSGFQKTKDITQADVLLLVTCAIREGAEMKIWTRLNQLKSMKQKNIIQRSLKIGLLGCMAERLKHKILEENKAVDVIAGPDSYRDLPRLLSLTENNQTAVNVLLSLDETYADVLPTRLNQDSVTAFVSIMRGCDNMCTYCIVPFTRGRERSRPISSILEEIKVLSGQGVKEITLLGQNVNSYRDTSETNHFTGLTQNETNLAKGFKTVYKPKKGGLRFSHLLDEASKIDPEMRIRFTSPHPKDFPDEVLYLIRERNNICNNLHIPAQSGSSSVLERMRRGYTRESYLELIENIKTILPDVSLSSDFICGFCGESDDEFEETRSLVERVQYNMAYIFAYSMREKTTAHRRYVDDVPKSVKMERVTELNSIFRENSKKINKSQIGSYQLILVEGESKKSKEYLFGRNDGNIGVVIPKNEIQISSNSEHMTPIKAGDYIVVMINEANSQVLKGIPLYHSTLQKFYNKHTLPYSSNIEVYSHCTSL